MQEQSKLTFEVTGDKEDLKNFIKMCSLIETMCKIGASRTIKTFVDGDGSANLRFALVDGKKKLDLPKSKIEGDDFSIGFGC